MRLSHTLAVVAVLPTVLVACGDLTGLGADPDAPVNLTYQLIPSGDPDVPLGVLLRWDVPESGRGSSFNVYGRSSGFSGWHLRATTTSLTFHDAGVPEEQYYVATLDRAGDEIARSSVVSIDLATQRLPAPQGLGSISLNRAIQLFWNDNVIAAAHGTFDYYRVYSAGYDGSRDVCRSDWVLEGTTVSDAFYAGNLVNGTSRCFAVSAVARDGHESTWSTSRLDTPRADGHNALVYAAESRPDSAGFAFRDDESGRLGAVGAVSGGDLDVVIRRHTDGSLWLEPARPGVAMALYSPEPIDDLTAIDRAPATGFADTGIEAVAGFGYVVRISEADGVHVAALRVAFETAEYVVFDWSYQTAPGNAELNRGSIESPRDAGGHTLP